MANLPRPAGGGIFQRMQPLVLAGTGWLDNTELGFPLGAGAITSAARIDSNPILVAGLNSFMVMSQLDGAYNVLFSHCDPFTDAILTTHSIVNALGGGVLNITTIGAFSTNTALTNTTGHVFYVIRLALQGNGANRTLTSIRLWLGTR